MRLPAFILAALCCAMSCMSLDVFLYAPLRASDGEDLLAGAVVIPASLRENLRLPNADGTEVDTYLLRHTADDGTPAAAHDTWILYCHGNAQNASYYAERAQVLWQLGYNVALFDYRGYGKTPGRPTEAGLYGDARAVLMHVQSVNTDARGVVIYGYSIGTAVATQLALESQAPALILESPFASVRELVKDNQALDVPRSWYTDAAFDTVGKIVDYRGVLLIMHGEADDFVRVAYSQQIARAARGHASSIVLWTPKTADHGNVPCLVDMPDAPGRTCPEGFDPAYLSLVASTIALPAGR